MLSFLYYMFVSGVHCHLSIAFVCDLVFSSGLCDGFAFSVMYVCMVNFVSFSCDCLCCVACRVFFTWPDVCGSMSLSSYLSNHFLLSKKSPKTDVAE